MRVLAWGLLLALSIALPAQASLSKQFKKQKIETANKLLQAKVPANGVKLEEEPDYIFMEFDVKANDAVYCELYSDGIDNAASQQAIVEAIIQDGLNSTAENSKLQSDVRRIAMEKDRIVMETLWLFTQGKDSEQLLRMSTATIQLASGAGFVCWNASSLSPDLFSELVSALASSAKVNVASAKPFYRDVVTFELQGRVVGYGENVLTRDDEDDIRVLSNMSMLMTIQPGLITTSDSQKIEWSSPNGDLINTYSVESENGNITSELSFEPGEGDTDWKVSGELQGKKVELEVNSVATVKSDVELLRAQYALLKKKDNAEYAFPVWIPASPDKVQITSIRRVSKKGKFVNMEAKVGPMTVDAKLSQDGKQGHMSMQMGHVKLAGETLFVQGRP